MKTILHAFLFLAFLTPSFAQKEDRRRGGGKGSKPDKKDADSWSAEEYSGLRGEKELQTAMASKGFTWITGSPADNEKLSIGKNAQFFGFVALRYQSGRAANRGMLGRAVFAICNEEQRAIIERAVLAEKEELEGWWQVREQILTLLEDHLYTGLPIDRDKLMPLGERFSLLNARVGTHEANAYAALEDSLSTAQREQLAAWRADAGSAVKYKGDRVESSDVPREDWKLLEDLCAKAFSWLTGKPEDNEIIPIGQPAQFFGFVSIRHKSGHGASRGTIARDFLAMLNSGQQGYIEEAAKAQAPVVREFLENRHQFLNQLAALRDDPAAYDSRRAEQFATAMGRLEMEAACIEAETYRKIRASMDELQVEAAMKMRGEYVIDETQIASMDMKQRGAALAILCTGCHGAPGMHRVELPAPSLDGFWDRKIASAPNFEYSTALSALAGGERGHWTPELLDQFLTNPRKFAPGTKMEFQGLLNPEDRKALIDHLKTSRR